MILWLLVQNPYCAMHFDRKYSLHETNNSLLSLYFMKTNWLREVVCVNLKFRKCDAANYTWNFDALIINYFAHFTDKNIKNPTICFTQNVIFRGYLIQIVNWDKILFWQADLISLLDVQQKWNIVKLPPCRLATGGSLTQRSKGPFAVSWPRQLGEFIRYGWNRW